ncbi:MAG TPA: DivIVA domain-containing protein [Acidimicrobiia bacterium]|nr:DivIVA domain-containing protein [Acidimicrobiia bacterium]
MTDQPTPEEIRRSTFRVAFRGFDQAEVAAHLDRLAGVVENLSQERDRLLTRLGEYADRDLKTEFETVGREVTAVLEAARAAADTMRERASNDAARWRSEATAESDTLRREARADAESMRSDAWDTGTQLLEQVQAEAERQRERLQRDSLTVMGEAEREAHRLTASARREAEDLLRTSKMESERMVAQARAEHDEIIATAHRQAEAAQERARALEDRRAELMDELDSVRAALASVEGELEERRQGIGLSEPSELTGRMLVVDSEGTELEEWEDGRTVRVIHPSRTADEGEEAAEESDEGEADAESLAEEVARLHEEEDDLEDPEEEPEPSQEEVGTDEAQEQPAGQPATADEVTDLFRRLRRPAAEEPEESEVSPMETPVPALSSEEASSGEVDTTGGIDPFETRERLLLPITNAALRGIKRALTEAQNESLEQLRLKQGEWAPDVKVFESAFQEDLEALADQASQAGVEAAVEMGMTGIGTLEPVSPAPNGAGADLAAAIAAALDSAGDGSRERQAAASRVFRGWRTDEAERRVRGLALESYHGALRQALESRERSWHWVPQGRMCSVCRQAAESGEAVPPAHRDCNCTIIPS